jgi:hypothetical protein
LIHENLKTVDQMAHISSSSYCPRTFGATFANRAGADARREEWGREKVKKFKSG